MNAETVNLLLQVAFLWAALYRMARWSAHYVARGWALAAALLLAATIPWGFLSIGYRISYPYDFPALFFSVAGLEAITSGRFRVLCLVTALGILNKETAVWLIPAFAGCAVAQSGINGPTLRRVALLCAVGGVAWAVPRALVQPFGLGFVRSMSLSAYDPAGETLIPRMTTNLRELAMLHRGDCWQNVYWPLAMMAPGLLLIWRLPRDMRGLYWGLPVFFVPTMLAANICEVRLFNEVLPLGILSALYLTEQGRPVTEATKVHDLVARSAIGARGSPGRNANRAACMRPAAIARGPGLTHSHPPVTNRISRCGCSCGLEDAPADALPRLPRPRQSRQANPVFLLHNPDALRKRGAMPEEEHSISTATPHWFARNTAILLILVPITGRACPTATRGGRPGVLVG